VNIHPSNTKDNIQKALLGEDKNGYFVHNSLFWRESIGSKVEKPMGNETLTIKIFYFIKTW
jgi:hypothetical protein